MVLTDLIVYALYERNRLVGGCLTAVFCGCNAAEGVFGMRSLFASGFDSNCLATTTPQDIALYACVYAVLGVYSDSCGHPAHS